MLEGWSEADMKAELNALAAMRNDSRRTGERLPEGRLRAAVMLHTDREDYERIQAPVVEASRECGINEHAGYARALIPLLVVQSSEASREFGRRWLTAMALSSHWDLCLDDARRWTHEGIKWFPKDATFHLIQGTAGEISGALTPVSPHFVNPRNRSQGFNDRLERRQELEQARRDLEAALSLQPDLHEARLRLGRVLWRLEKLPQARAPLQAVVDQAKDPALLYLAHLFLGRVLEDSSELAPAVEHYRAALAIDAGAQAAAVALSQALLLAGEDSEAREVLDRALQHAPRAEPRDAFMSYHLGHSGRAGAMLEALRAETLE